LGLEGAGIVEQVGNEVKAIQHDLNAILDAPEMQDILFAKMIL
jgi:hypothetical protein